MGKILIIADDLTGAVDTSAQFANRGIPSSVAVEAEFAPGWSGMVHAMNAGTREIGLAEARSTHMRIGQQLRSESYEIVVKKTDMGFRGNHGGEIEGLLEGMEADLCCLVNAIPGHYASVVDACQYVKGKLLPESMYAQDPSRKPTTAFIPEILSRQTRLKIGTIFLREVRSPDLARHMEALAAEQCRILVLDAVTEEDCLAAVRAVRSLRKKVFFAGTLGIMNALSQYCFPDCPIQPFQTADPMPRCLGFTTSNYDTVQRQLVYARERGLAQVVLRMDDCLVDEAHREAELQRVFAQCTELLRDRNVIVTQHLRHPPAVPDLSERILDSMAACAGRLCGRCSFSRLVLIGGETAHVILNALGARHLSIAAMPETGVALGRLEDGALKGRSFAAKGGSVGTEQAIWRMLTAADPPRG